MTLYQGVYPVRKGKRKAASEAGAISELQEENKKLREELEALRKKIDGE